MRNKLLIAEDEKSSLLILERIFGENFELLKVQDGEQVLSVLHAHAQEIQLLILDLDIPKKDGFEVLSAMRASAELRDIPVIAVTGYDDIQRGISAFDLGVWDIIQKPFDPDAVCICVNNVLQKRREHEEAIRQIGEQLRGDELFTVLDHVRAGVAVCELGDRGAYLYKNKKFDDLLGFSRKDAIREVPLISLVFELYRDDIRQALIDASLASSKEIIREFEILSLNRKALYIEGIFRSIEFGNKRDKAILIAIVDITQRKQNEEKEKIIHDQMRYHFEHDALSGLYNKVGFRNKVSEYILDRLDAPYSIIYCDLCRFRMVNTMLGNETGDRVLVLVSRYIRNMEAKYKGVCARLENDRFALCVPRQITPKEAAELQGTINLLEYGLDFRVSLKYGIYEIDDVHMPIEEMCEKANMALAVAKADPYCVYAFYDEKLKNTVAYEMRISDDMEAAIEEKQFVLFLQPVHSLSSGEPQAAEVLVRWQHPQMGLVQPGRFIPIFEKNGFIEKLDSYVWEETCKLLRRRIDEGKRQIPLSVNLSRRSIYNTNAAEEIIGLADKYEIDPTMLRLEVTESVYIDNLEQMTRTVQALRDYGFTIMMDDFGSGYSSLNMLKELPVDVLKIDMKFLQGFENSTRAGSIIAAILRMARWLGIPVIAEGVETSEQISFLHSIGCDWIQGYYFAKPMPLDEFDRYLSSYRQIPSLSKSSQSSNFDSDAYLGGNQAVNQFMNMITGGFAILELCGDRLEIIRVNEEYYEIFGYSPEVFASTSKNVWEKMEKKRREKEKQIFIRAAREGKKQRAVITDYHADGHLLWLDCSFFFLGGTQDHGIFCVSYNDITETKRLAAQLEDARQKLREMTENIRMFERDTQAPLGIDTLKERELKRHVYELLLSNSDTFVFDYDVAADSMYMFFADDDGAHSVEKLPAYTKNVKKFDFFDPSQQDQYEKQFFTFLERPLTGEMLFRVKRRKSQSYRWYRAQLRSMSDHNGRVYRVLGKAEDVDERIKSQENVQEKAALDSMSGLLNRASTENAILSVLQEHHGYCAIFLIDIDDMERVNDALGHIFGDALIKEVGVRIKMSFGQEAVVGRYSGDSFVAFMKDIRDESVARMHAKAILDTVGLISLPQLEAISCSIGIAIVDPGCREYPAIHKAAEAALYEAKAHGKHDFCVQKRSAHFRRAVHICCFFKRHRQGAVLHPRE